VVLGAEVPILTLDLDRERQYIFGQFFVGEATEPGKEVVVFPRNAKRRVIL